MILLNPGSEHQFKQIFGPEYTEISIERDYLVRLGDHNITSRKIHSIL